MEERRKSPEEGQSKGIYFLELPMLIILDILSRLPLSAIVNCRCVCKAFLDLLKDPYFVKLYHARTSITILQDNSLQRNFYLLEHETYAAGVPRCRAIRPITTLNNFSEIKWDPLVRNNENDYNDDNTSDQGFHDSWHGASMLETFALHRCVYLGGKVGVSGFL